jgi:cob(I)alamin adenosyltransferase
MKKFYTGKGDAGITSTLKTASLSKSEPVIELLGTLDEACAFLTLATLHFKDGVQKELVCQVERDLNVLMAEVAGDTKSSLTVERVDWLEGRIKDLGETILRTSEFIHHWEHSSTALLNIARTVLRRAERIAVVCFEEKSIANPQVLRYLNRLSSFIFVLQLEMENPPSPG